MTDPALTRRRALAGAAVGGLSLPLLAACGSGGSSNATAQDPSAATGGNGNNGNNGTTAKSQAVVLVAASDVPVGGGVILGDQNVTVTQPQKGTFEGFSATCTHQGCILASVAGGTINCGCHGSQFSITDGSNVAGPSGSPAGSVAALPKVSVRVKGADVVQG
ncbi:Rieske (2Fe-2S) protein [Nocardioides sp.]|uniref:Rieske (2Fe-2S) protein n=1 Tax=Nocardioides sp. TaxID=35761 RepID=UPI002F42F26F